MYILLVVGVKSIPTPESTFGGIWGRDEHELFLRKIVWLQCDLKPMLRLNRLFGKTTCGSFDILVLGFMS